MDRLLPLRYSVRLNSLDSIAVTRLDVLDQMKKIKMCVGYKIDGMEIKQIPASLKLLGKVEPVYESFNGWMCDTTGCRKFEDLPEGAKKYLRRLSEVSSRISGKNQRKYENAENFLRALLAAG